MEIHRDARGFPGARSGASRTPHSHDQLTPLTSDTDQMRPSPIRPITDFRLDVGEHEDPTRIYAIDHSDPGWSADWRLYRKIGETQEWGQRRRLYCTHHVLVDATGRTWYVSWRAWQDLQQDDLVRLARMDSGWAVSVVEKVQEGAYEWPQALRMLETIDPGEEAPQGREEYLDAPAVAGEGRHE